MVRTCQAGITFAGLNPGGYIGKCKKTRMIRLVYLQDHRLRSMQYRPHRAVPTVASVVSTYLCSYKSERSLLIAQAGCRVQYRRRLPGSQRLLQAVAPGTYTLTVRSTVDGTCTTDAASTVTIDAVPYGTISTGCEC